MNNQQLNVSNVNSLLDQVVNQFIVRPKSLFGMNVGFSGFVFDILDEEQIQIESEITDHYVEENFAIQDHIALRPEKFTLRGYVAELSDIVPSTALSVLTNIQSLGSIGAFFPEFTFQATQVYGKIASTVSRVGERINQVRNLYDIFTQADTSTRKQQKAYNYFYSMWQARQLFDIETPYTVFKNMAIDNMRITQGAQTRYISDFAISFKRIRTSLTITAFTTSNNPEGSGVIAGKKPVLADRLFQKMFLKESNGQTAGTKFSTINEMLKSFQ